MLLVDHFVILWNSSVGGEEEVSGCRQLQMMETIRRLQNAAGQPIHCGHGQYIFVYIGKIPSLRQVLLNRKLHNSLVTLVETFYVSRTDFRGSDGSWKMREPRYPTDMLKPQTTPTNLFYFFETGAVEQQTTPYFHHILQINWVVEERKK